MVDFYHEHISFVEQRKENKCQRLIVQSRRVCVCVYVHMQECVYDVNVLGLGYVCVLVAVRLVSVEDFVIYLVLCRSLLELMTPKTVLVSICHHLMVY